MFGIMKFIKEGKAILLVVLCQYLCLGASSTSTGCRKEDPETVVCNFIPTDLENGVTKVRIVNFLGDSMKITSGNFTGNNWKNVVYLELSDDRVKDIKRSFVIENDCFVKLTKLEEFQMHINRYVSVYADAFTGLDNVKTLDLSKCLRISFDQLLAVLNTSTNLPRLQNLKLSNFGVIRGDPLSVDETLLNALLPRNITEMDLSDTQISLFNVTAFSMQLTDLQVMNLSYATISKFYSKHANLTDVVHLKVLDFSHASLPKSTIPYFPGTIEIADTEYSYPTAKHNFMLNFLPETLNVSGVMPKGFTILFSNVTLKVTEDLKWEAKNLVLRQNRFHRMDIIVKTNYTIDKLETIDFSDNDMSFLNPSVLEFMPNLKEIDLSKNNFTHMVLKNYSVFESLLSKMYHVRKISLSFNHLSDIPMGLFRNCTMLEEIDLSHNKLTQIGFVVSDLLSLRILDLSYNNIQNLDSQSLSHLDSIHSSAGHNLTVIFESNPISCSKCATKPFLDWLSTTKLTNVKKQKLKCTDEKGNQRSIDKAALHHVNKICHKNDAIIAAAITTIAIVLVIIIVALVCRRKRTHYRRLQNRTNTIEELREGNWQYEFVVFLSYSNDDQDFVRDHVRGPLNENLQLMTGIDRDLVCIGDENLRRGVQIQEEALRSMDRASVVMVVVSENFCASAYCRRELDHAYMRRKPILLMFIDHVDNHMMMPTMQELYRKSIRFSWANENGEMVLKSSWETVCRSVLDLIH